MAPKIKLTAPKPASVPSIYVDKDGNVLDAANTKLVADAYAANMMQFEDVDTVELTPDEIMDILSKHPGDGRNGAVQQARLAALIQQNANKAEPLPTVDTTAFTNKQAEAWSLGEAFSDEASEHLVAAVTGREKYSGAWMLVAADLDTIAMDAVQAEKLASAPYPNSTPAGSKGRYALPNGSNEESDITGEGKTRRSYWATVLDATPYGKKLTDIIAVLNKAKAHGKNDETAGPAPTEDEVKLFRTLSGELAPLSGKALNTMSNRWNGQRTTAIGRLRLAQRFRIQRDAFNGLPNFSVQPVEDNVELCSTKNKAIEIVWTNPDPKATRKSATTEPMTIGTFLALRPDRLKDKKITADTMEDVVKASRPPRAPRTTQTVTIPQQPNVNQVEDMFTALIEFAKQTPSKAAFHKWLNDADTGDEHVDLLGEVVETLRSMYAPVQARHKRIIEAQQKVEEDEAA